MPKTIRDNFFQHLHNSYKDKEAIEEYRRRLEKEIGLEEEIGFDTEGVEIVVGYVDGKPVLGSIIRNNTNRKTTSC